MKMGLNVLLSRYYCNIWFWTPIVLKNLDIIMLETRQYINSMGLNASLSDYKNKQLFTNMKMPATNVIQITKITSYEPNRPLCALGSLLFSQLNK